MFLNFTYPLDHQNHVNHSAQTYKNFIGRLFFLWLELVAYFCSCLNSRKT